MNPYNPTAVPKKDNQKLFYIVLTVALIASWIYIFWDQAATKKNELALAAKIKTADSSRNALQTEYNAALLRLDELTNMNASLDSLVATKDDELTAMKNRIQRILSNQIKSDRELAEAKKLIEQLNNQITGYVTEIEKLKAENLQLQNDKTTLISQQQNLQRKLSENEKAKDEIKAELEEASTLFASNIQINAFDLRKSGKEVQKSKANKVDLLRLTFDVYSRAGKESVKELFIVIIDPSDKIVTLNELGSGKFISADEGEKEYTKKIAVNFKPGLFSPASVEWKPTTRLSGGTYKVIIYNNGYKIGNDAIVLR
jgi:DNA repair exonuclease SbcCD ATPase subunit